MAASRPQQGSSPRPPTCPKESGAVSCLVRRAYGRPRHRVLDEGRDKANIAAGMETPVLVALLRSRTGVLVCALGSEPPSSEHVGGGDHDCKDPERSQEPIR